MARISEKELRSFLKKHGQTNVGQTIMSQLDDDFLSETPKPQKKVDKARTVPTQNALPKQNVLPKKDDIYILDQVIWWMISKPFIILWKIITFPFKLIRNAFLNPKIVLLILIGVLFIPTKISIVWILFWCFKLSVYRKIRKGIA